MSIAPKSTGQMSVLAQVLAGRMKRDRWKDRFNGWWRPASDTEEQRMAAAERRVLRAIDACPFLRDHNWRVVPQGSYHNNTNVRADSDVDIAICLEDVIVADGPPNDVPTLAELGRVPSLMKYDDFKSEVAAALKRVYGNAALHEGKKALQLHADDEDRVSVDIVPAFKFELYGPRNPPNNWRCAPATGIMLMPGGQRITNFPAQHYVNGCAKNDETGNRYKWVVRILKRLRNHIALDTSAPPVWRQIVEKTPSFLVECLVFNCPPELFGHEEIYDDVVGVLRYLAIEFGRERRGLSLASIVARDYWREVNGVKPLFADGKPWSEADAAAFVAVAELYIAR